MTRSDSNQHFFSKDWRVLVAGGSKGIGKAVALSFAEHGASVAVCARQEAPLADMRDVLQPHGQTSYVDQCDVSDPGSVESFVSSASQALGGLDVVVNCASAFAISDDEAGWAESLNVDLMGSVRMTWAALPMLRQSRSPSIVNVSSVAALQATGSRVPYGAAKAAIVHQTASNAKLLAKDGIRVNCVLPGSTEFPGGVWDRIAQNNPELYEKTRRDIPLQRLATPDDIAKVILFLASPDAGWITGQSITVDGGQTLFGF